MMNFSEKPEAGVGNLMKPTERIETNLLRETIKEISSEQKTDFLETEERYTRTRSALTHLLHHESYRSEIFDKVADFVELSRKFLQHPDAPTVLSAPRVAKLMEITNRIEAAADLDLKNEQIARSDVNHFIDVVDRNRQVHIRRHYSPANIVDHRIYALARMIVGNFDAYDRTLNEK